LEHDHRNTPTLAAFANGCLRGQKRGEYEVTLTP